MCSLTDSVHQAIDAIADLLSWLQPSLTIKPAAIQDQIGSPSSLYLMSLERVNLLLSTLQTVLTITGSNNDVYLKVVPLILKEIYTDLSKCPDCYTKQGEADFYLQNILHIQFR